MLVPPTERGGVRVPDGRHRQLRRRLLTGCNMPAGDLFPFGTTTVELRRAGPGAAAAQHGELRLHGDRDGHHRPTITCPAHQHASAPGAARPGDPGNGDGVDICAPLSSLTTHGTGSFPRGTTPLTYTATDHGISRRAAPAPHGRGHHDSDHLVPGQHHGRVHRQLLGVRDPGPAAARLCAQLTITDAASGELPDGHDHASYTATDEVDPQRAARAPSWCRTPRTPTITCPAPIVAECQGTFAARVSCPARRPAPDIAPAWS